jgi:DNA modification methylase
MTSAVPEASVPRAPLRAWPATQVELWPLERIKPYPRNARVHTEDQVRQIAESMTRFGVTTPLLVDEEGVLLYGHGRLRAAQYNGYLELPVSVARDWPEMDKEAYRLWDNQSATLSRWDEPMLKLTLAGLKLGGFPVGTLGFANLPRLLATLTTKDPNEAPERPERPVTQPGDVWLLGAHRLVCADATLERSWARLFTVDQARHLAAMVFTDPPYGVSYESAADEAITGDDKRRDDLYKMLNRAFRAMVKNTTATAAFYIWHASVTRNDFSQALAAAGLIERQYLIWAKPSIVLGHADYRWAHEPCFYASHAGHKPAFYGEPNESTVWRVALTRADDTAAVIGPGLVLLDGHGDTLYLQSKSPKGKTLRQIRLTAKQPVVHLAGESGSSTGTVWEVTRERDYVHPTQKPVELARRAIENSSQPGEIIADGFVGSGTTLIGAELTGRRAYALEVDPAYCDVAVERWQTLTEQDAVLQHSGNSFEQTREQRDLIVPGR